LAYDVKNSSDDEWCRKAKSDYKTLFEEDHTHDSNGGGGFSFIKLFSLNGSGGLHSSSKLKQALDQMLASEDCGKAILSNAFKYDWQGEHWEPKGIIAYEV